MSWRYRNREAPQIGPLGLPDGKSIEICPFKFALSEALNGSQFVAVPGGLTAERLVSAVVRPIQGKQRLGPYLDGLPSSGKSQIA